MPKILIALAICTLIGVILYIRLSTYNTQDYNKQHLTENPQVKSTTGKTKVTYKDISPKEAKENLNNDKSIILLDVRTIQEYEEKHIPNSLLIPLDSITADTEQKIPNKDTTLYVYCRSGSRSVSASKVLIGLGYANVYNLGGIIDWPYETE